MSFLKSPGVHVREIDLTTIVPSVPTTIGAIAGAFQKGPVNSIVTVGNEDDMVKVFGKPQNNSNQFETFFTAANFLQYSDQLKIVRCESGVTNAIASGTSFIIRDDDHYEDSFKDGQGSVGEWLQELPVFGETQLVFLFAPIQQRLKKLLSLLQVLKKRLDKQLSV